MLRLLEGLDFLCSIWFTWPNSDNIVQSQRLAALCTKKDPRPWVKEKSSRIPGTMLVWLDVYSASMIRDQATLLSAMGNATKKRNARMVRKCFFSRSKEKDKMTENGRGHYVGAFVSCSRVKMCNEEKINKRHQEWSVEVDTAVVFSGAKGSRCQWSRSHNIGCPRNETGNRIGGS